jgi:serine protease Do
LLDQQAQQLRQLARDVHHEQLIRELAKAAEGADDKLDLLRCGLLIARLDNDEVEVEAYQRLVDRMARELASRLPKGATEAEQLAELNGFFFTDYGFHGSRTNYYHRSNSYLNEVLDDREGLPITLSVVYMELARRVGMNIVGVSLPRHFVVKQMRRDGTEQLLDVFDGGKAISRAEAAELAGAKLSDEHFLAATRRSILVRLLGNLLSLAQAEENDAASLRYLDAVVAVAPQEGNHRAMRAVLRMRAQRIPAALDDCDWLLKHQPEGVDLERVQQLRDFIERLRQ